ncbi:TonB-dependent receptor domain-containing protein [Azohydromonas aeria]|uniref:TonB-dependent receptor domain-containing protein n=1 Tax=Azohydromonas aeria TaxID=2590212 RepID=UPI0012F754C1|nr:TonB-dependent receptor [Azohydromonas aeria]
MKSMSFRGAALCGLSLLALTPIASAAEAALQPWTVAAADSPAQPVVVTATRIAQPVSQALADVRVIDAQQIRDAGAMSVTELLQTFAGAEIASNGGPGQLSSVFLRGANANHVVVLVDGVRVSSATAGSNAFEHLPVNQIERIEVLRGPASSLYGADAIGGVIQIFTKQGEHTEARVGAGRWDTREASAGIGRRFGDTSVSLRAGYKRTDGFSATNPAIDAPGTPAIYQQFNADRDGYRNRNLGGSVSHDWAQGHTLSARGWASEGRTQFDQGPLANDVVEQRLSGLSLESRNRVTQAWTSRVLLARGTDDYKTRGDFPSRFRTDQDQLTWQNDFTLPVGTLAAGLEWRREQVDSNTSYAQTRRIVRSAFGSYAAALGAHRLETSVRHDDNSQFGGDTTGRLGYGYQLAPAWRLSAAAGTAFKAPSFNDLYYQSEFFFGNPDLRPERSRNVEAAARYDDGTLRGGLTLFRNRIRNLIAIDPATFSTVINVNAARSRGATLDAGWRTAQWSAHAEATFQQPEDTATDHLLPRRARRFGSAGLDWTPGPWRAGVEVVGSGARFNELSNTNRLGGYVLLNLKAAYALTPELSVLARLNNLTDKGYELAHGYNTPGRNLFVALEYAPK